MTTFTLGLRTGGLMEDPEWHIEKIRTVSASDLREAKRIYADLTELSNKPEWNPTTQTFWGWEIVRIYET